MSTEADARPSMSQVCIDLEVLLEPEREAERAEERAKTRARRALSRARWVAVVVLIGGGVVGGLALWKRETLRLASEVEAARAAGEESFDKLDTCIASFGITSREARVCSQDLTGERAAHEKTLGSLAKQGEGCAEAVDSIKDLRTQMQGERKKHEDELKAVVLECTAAKDKLTTELGGDRDKWKTDKETCDAAAKQQAIELAQAQTERDQCVQGTPPTPSSSGPAVGPAPTGNPTAAPTTNPYDPPPTPSGPASETAPTTVPTAPPPETAPPPTAQPTTAQPSPTAPVSQSGGLMPGGDSL